MTEQQEAAMRQALEALIEVTGWQWAGPMRVMDEVEDAITALTAALADHALDKKAENARELGLDYGLEQPAQQEPVAGKPLPCPFCGHIGLDFSDGSTYRWGLASCGGCGATCGEVRREYPDKGEWHSEAVAEWNRRYTRPQAREPVIDKSAAKRIATALGWEPKRQPLTDEDLIECERLADIRHRKHMESIRGQQLSSADQFLWHYARAIEAAHGIKGDA